MFAVNMTVWRKDVLTGSHITRLNYSEWRESKEKLDKFSEKINKIIEVIDINFWYLYIILYRIISYNSKFAV